MASAFERGSMRNLCLPRTVRVSLVGHGQEVCVQYRSFVNTHSSVSMLCCVQEIAQDILTEQTPKKLLEVRGKVYELLVNVVPPELIIRQLAAELMKKLDDEVKHDVRFCMCFQVALELISGGGPGFGWALCLACCWSGKQLLAS